MVEDLISTRRQRPGGSNRCSPGRGRGAGYRQHFHLWDAEGAWTGWRRPRLKNVSLTNFDVIAQVAAEDGYIDSADITRLIAFRNNPATSWIGGNA